MAGKNIFQKTSTSDPTGKTFYLATAIKDFFISFTDLAVAVGTAIGISTKLDTENFDNYTKLVEWEIYFYEIWDEIELIHETDVQITSVVLNKAVTLQYSIDNGLNWINYTVPFTITDNYSRWRVSNFGAFSNGSVIIKATKL